MPSIGQIWADFGIKNRFKEGFAQVAADMKAASKQAAEQMKQAGELAGKSLSDGVKATSGQLQAQMKLIQAQFKQATAELGLNASETDKLRVKSEALNSQLGVQQQIVQSLTERYQKAVQIKGENSKEATRLATSLANAKAAEANIRNEIDRANDEITKQTTAVGRLRDEWQRATEEARNNLGSAFDQMQSAGMAITAAGAGMAAGLGVAVAKSADFGAQMAKVQVLSDATTEEMQKLRQAALEIGPTMGFSADQASTAMQQLAASGYNAKQMVTILPAVMNAAAAAGEDLGLATELVASQLQVFKMSAEQAGHVSDVLAQAANISAIGLQDLQYSLKYAGPVAAAVGIRFEELSAAIAVMGNQGIKGEQAGTTLRASLLRLVDPPREARAVLEQLGVAITDSQGKMLPLADIIGQLQTKMQGLTDTQKAQVLSTIFSTESVSGMLALIRQGPAVIQDYTNQLENSTGASERAAKAMKDNLAGSLSQLKASLYAAAVSIGDTLAPTVRKVADFISSLVKSFNSLDPHIKKVVATVAAFAAGLALIGGPLLILVGILPSIAAGFQIVTKAITAARAALVALTAANPILLAISVAVGVVAAAAYGLYKAWTTNWGGIQQKTHAVGAAIVAIFNSVVTSVTIAFNQLKEKIWTLLQGIMNALSPVVGLIGEIAPGFETGFEKLRTTVANKVDDVKVNLQDLQAKAAETSKQLNMAFANVKGAFSSWVAPKGMGDFRKEAEGIEKAAKGIKNTGLDVDLSKFGLAGADAGSALASAGEKAKKAAEDTRAAWEQTADVLSTRLQIIQAQQEIAAIAAGRHGNQTQALADKITWLNKELDVQQQIVAAVNQGYRESVRVKGANSEETLKLALRLEQEKKAQAELEKQLYDTAQATKEQANQLRELADEVTAVEKKYREDLTAAAEEYQRKVEEVNSKLIADEQRLTDEYNKSVASRAKSLRDFVGLFDAVANKKVSGDELLRNLGDQVTAFKDWSANIQSLAARGVDQGLIAELKEMGPKAGPEIAALNSLTNDQLAQYVSLWREKSTLARVEAQSQLEQQRIETLQKIQELRVQAAEQLEAYRAEWEKKNAEIRKNTEEEIKRIHKQYQDLVDKATGYGISLMTNFIGGIESQFERLRKAMEDMAAIVDSYMPHSPAKHGPLRKIMEWGPALVGSLTEGIRGSLPMLERAAGAMAGVFAPGGLVPAGAVSYATTTTTTVNTFHITVSGGSTSDQADQLLRELARRGVRL